MIFKKNTNEIFFLSVGDPDRKDFLQGYTALHYAAKEDNLECLELLLEAGGDYNITNNNGTTCLDISKGQCLNLLQSLSKLGVYTTSLIFAEIGVLLLVCTILILS